MADWNFLNGNAEREPEESGSDARERGARHAETVRDAATSAVARVEVLEDVPDSGKVLGRTVVLALAGLIRAPRTKKKNGQQYCPTAETVRKVVKAAAANLPQVDGKPQYPVEYVTKTADRLKSEGILFPAELFGSPALALWELPASDRGAVAPPVDTSDVAAWLEGK